MTADTTRYLTEAETARHLKASRRSLQRWRVDGNGPPFIRVGARRVLYDADAIARWTDGRTFAHRAAELTAA